MVNLIPKKGSTLHDFPYSSAGRKCPHFWIINVTPPGPAHCIHHCLYCYARQAVYSDFSKEMVVYNNLPELVERDLRKIDLCPPISISNVADPCQPIPELQFEVKRLVKLLMDYGIGFDITTKGDPSFLLDLPSFIEYQPKFIGVTIEGTADVLRLLSPAAPSFERRIETVRRLSRLGIDTLIRLDPVFPHLFLALYGDSWLWQVEELISAFAGTGVRHIICSTGRLSKRTFPGAGASLQERVRRVIAAHSPEAARRFEAEYVYERGTSQGYLWRKDLRLEFHHEVKAVVEARGMTYTTCQELSAAESDSSGLPHCERFLLPFSRKQPDGRFKPIAGCTANCHVACRGLAVPPCGQPRLISPKPFKISHLKSEVV